MSTYTLRGRVARRFHAHQVVDLRMPPDSSCGGCGKDYSGRACNQVEYLHSPRPGYTITASTWCGFCGGMVSKRKHMSGPELDRFLKECDGVLIPEDQAPFDTREESAKMQPVNADCTCTGRPHVKGGIHCRM